MNDKQKLFEEKKQNIRDSFQRSLDKETSYIRCGVTKEEWAILDSDFGFQQELSYFLVKEKENLLSTLKDLTKAGSKDEVRLRAVMELGKILWREKFDPGKIPERASDLPEEIEEDFNEIEEDHNDNTAAVLEILSESGGLKPPTEKAAKGKTH